MTLNEPMDSMIGLGYVAGICRPALPAPARSLRRRTATWSRPCRAYRAIKEGDPDALVGLAHAMLDAKVFLYLATVIDLHSRRLVGWAIADHMRTDLVIDALNAAQRTRGSLAGAIFHSDHGNTRRNPSLQPALRPGSGSR